MKCVLILFSNLDQPPNFAAVLSLSRPDDQSIVQFDQRIHDAVNENRLQVLIPGYELLCRHVVSVQNAFESSAIKLVFSDRGLF